MILFARDDEEAFDYRRRKAGKARMGGNPKQDAGNDVLSALFYVIIGVGLALLVKQAMVYALNTDMPIVAVVSESMEHHNIDVTYYGWLKQRFGYTREYVDTWPVGDGFNVGDMPIVEGDAAYGIGDVVVYSVSGQDVPIIHRIVKQNLDGTFQTKGDNNINQLPYEVSVKVSSIHGKVIFVVPKLGYFKVFMTRVFGIQ
jgi:hypothetical protein